MKTRQLFQTSAAALTLVGAMTAPAHALDVVYDPSNYAQAVQQVTQLTQQLAVMQQQYQQLVMTYQALTRVTDLGSAVSALNMMGIRNPLPINPYAAQSLLNGTGGASGMLNSLSGLYTGTGSVAKFSKDQTAF